MRSLVDANVLLPLLCEGHPLQASAYAWFETRQAASVAWCLPVRLAILRHLSNERVMGSGLLAPGVVLDVWQQLARDERMVEVTTVPIGVEERFRANVAGRRPSPKLWRAAWLAALAECLGYEMVTSDRGFREFELSALSVLGGGE